MESQGVKRSPRIFAAVRLPSGPPRSASASLSPPAPVHRPCAPALSPTFFRPRPPSSPPATPSPSHRPPPPPSTPPPSQPRRRQLFPAPGGGYPGRFQIASRFSLSFSSLHPLYCALYSRTLGSSTPSTPSSSMSVATGLTDPPVVPGRFIRRQWGYPGGGLWGQSSGCNSASLLVVGAGRSLICHLAARSETVTPRLRGTYIPPRSLGYNSEHRPPPWNGCR